MGYLDRLKNLRGPGSGTDKTDKSSLADTPIPLSTIRGFARECLVFDPSARTRGADILLALATWRRVVQAPDLECTWQRLVVHLTVGRVR